ncbi:glycosyltransferase [bacterium]|nr:glycosyltransferase [bacterium]
MKNPENSVKISAVIICYNEARNIARCIHSLQGVADEILVLDSYSTDQTPAICQSMQVRFEQHTFDGHIEQKNRAMQLATYPIVLSLDADEALSDTLAASILAVKHNWRHEAYAFNRKTNYAGQWIKHCGWYPDTKIRLWNRNLGRWGGYNPHDKVELKDGLEPIWLNGDLYHYSFYSIAEHKAKVQRYSSIKAKAVFARGKKSNLLLTFAAPVFKFLWTYFVRLGFLDGYHGLVICYLSAVESRLTYRKILKLQGGQSI